MKRYIVYVIWNPIKDNPFYVGWTDLERKGTNTTRMDDHLKEARRYKETGLHDPWANLHKIRTINKILSMGSMPIFKIAFETDDLTVIHAKETEFIKLYGRADLGEGPLTNLTDGGEGVTNQSIATRKKRSKTMKGRPSPLKGRTFGPHSEERRRKNSEAQKGKKLTEEHREKLRLQTPWNKGLTKDTDTRMEKIASQMSRTMKGREPWNKGLTKETDERVAGYSRTLSENAQGRKAWNKGKKMESNGKSYEEIHGPEKAAELKEKRRQKKLEYWANKKAMNQ